MGHRKVQRIDRSTAKARGKGAASGRRGARTVFGTAKAVPEEVQNARAGRAARKVAGARRFFVNGAPEGAPHKDWSQKRPTLQKAKDGAPASSKARDVRPGHPPLGSEVYVDSGSYVMYSL
jgi:hypothetical protein